MSHPESNGRLRRSLLALVASVLLPAVPAAGAAGDMELKPFRATYAATLNGMPMGVAVTLELKNPDADNWALALAAKSAMINYREESSFRWRDCTSIPQRYRYDFSGFGMSRKLWLDFDHATHRARGESRKGPLDYEFPADATDELSLTFAARCQFARGASDAQFNVATTAGMRRLGYHLAGKETVKTPWGKVEALRIERVRKDGDKRRSTLWVAPSLGYLMVKMEHVEKLGVRGSVVLKELEMAGSTVTSVPPAPLKAAAP